MTLKNKKYKKGFSDQEATILIDAYIQVQEKKLSKEEAIQKVSKELRQRAINIGMKMEESFRSVSDINVMWHEVENVFEHGFRSKAPYIFIDMVDCYQNNKTYFDEVLQTAKQQVNLHKIQQSVETSVEKVRTQQQTNVEQLIEIPKGEQYFDWLSGNLTSIIDIDDIVLEEEQPQKYIKQEYVEMILTEKFQRGFSKGYLDINKFIKYYNEKFNMNFNIQNQTIRNEIENKIANVGILYKSKIFPVGIIPDEVKQQLIQYIYKHFEQNHKVLYYETVYQKFKEQLDTKIYDADMLKVYLLHILSKEYYFEQHYMTKERNATIDISEEIKRIMLYYGAPVLLEKIYSQLDYITEKEIKDTIKGREFISNKTGEYFHIDMFDFSEKELDEMTSIIEEVLSIYDDMIEIKKLLSILDEKCPHIMERFSQYSEIGKRDALKYYLEYKFSFQTYYVSSKDKNMSIEKDFYDFSIAHDFFTIEQLKSLKKDINSKLLSIVYNNAVRISETNFVSKKQITFDVKQIDMELEKHCTGEYIPLQEIDMKFLPNVAFPWTIYLLEQYVAFYSETFKLVHRNFAITSCTGAIVKQKSNINKFDDLLIDELIKSNIELNNDTAMKYLQSKGYFKNQNYKVDKIVEEAIMIIQQRGSF
ncbi:hypothetical protein AAK894_02585 [Lachnospiraceae bacterium 46-61]